MDLWLVTEDYTASNDRELSVSRGQQVELVDAQPTSAPSGDTPYYLIRLANPDTADWASAEGMVPSTVLKQLPGLRGSGSRSSITIDGEGGGEFTVCNNVCGGFIHLWVVVGIKKSKVIHVQVSRLQNKVSFQLVCC